VSISDALMLLLAIVASSTGFYLCGRIDGRRAQHRYNKANLRSLIAEAESDLQTILK
jgi:hypothetical protein